MPNTASTPQDSVVKWDLDRLTREDGTVTSEPFLSYFEGISFGIKMAKFL